MTHIRYSILGVDDHQSMRGLYQACLAEKYDLDVASNADEALKFAASYPYDLYLMDLLMPGINGIECIRSLKRIRPQAQIIVVSQTDEIDHAIEAFKENILDFIRKPIRRISFLASVERNLRFINTQQAYRNLSVETSRDSDCPEPVFGNSAEMTQFWQKVKNASRSHLVRAVLITGESGTGKEIVARTFHRWSSRCQSPFICLNCALLTKELAASELFGIAKGIATGVEARMGRFSLAHTGTLFLDEVTELPLDIQGMLLRALQERRIQRVGSAKDEEIDVIVIAATNRDIRKSIEDGQFREDLFYRLSSVMLHVPPLRDRIEDIDDLLLHLFQRRGGRGSLPLDKDELMEWRTYPWPGNIRQLENAMINRIICGHPIDLTETSAKPSGFSPDLNAIDIDETLQLLVGAIKWENLKERIFRLALEKAQGNVRQAAKILDVPSSTMWDFASK